MSNTEVGQDFSIFQVGEIMVFANHAYAQMISADAGTGAMEVFADLLTPCEFLAFGFKMMWNLEYGVPTRGGPSSIPYQVGKCRYRHAERNMKYGLSLTIMGSVSSLNICHISLPAFTGSINHVRVLTVEAALG